MDPSFIDVFVRIVRSTAERGARDSVRHHGVQEPLHYTRVVLR